MGRNPGGGGSVIIRLRVDNLTHTLVGIAISRAGFKGRLPYATTALIIAANLPDIDVVAGWNGVGFLATHRSLTHSLVALPALAVLIAWGLRWAAGYHFRRQQRQRQAHRDAVLAVGRVRSTPGEPRVKSVRLEDLWPEAAGAPDPDAAPETPPLPSWRLCLLLGFVGVGSHILLDMMTSFGVRVLWPFSQHWFAWDFMPEMDPWVWIILLFLLLAPMTLGLVGSEIGARRRPHRLSAIIALAAVTAWIGVRAFYHYRVVRLLAETEVGGHAPRKVGAFPYAGSPGLWHTVVETKGRYQLGMVDATAARLLPPALAAAPPQTLYTPAVTPQIALARSTPQAQVFLHFARFPYIYTQQRENGGTNVLITDLRFKAAHEPVNMGLLIRESANLHVQSTHLYWRGAAAALGPQP